MKFQFDILMSVPIKISAVKTVNDVAFTNDISKIFLLRQFE